MIALSTLTFDPDGHVVLRELPDSNTRDLRRRTNRLPTLDGGVSLNDAGFSHGDRTFVVRWRGDDSAVRRLVRLYGRLRVSTRDGVFLAAPEGIRQRNGRENELTLLVLESLT